MKDMGDAGARRGGAVDRTATPDLHSARTQRRALVLQLGSHRNAIYKTVFEARREPRVALAAYGHVDNDLARRS
jgi:hypothetical protein